MHSRDSFNGVNTFHQLLNDWSPLFQDNHRLFPKAERWLGHIPSGHWKKWSAASLRPYQSMAAAGGSAVGLLAMAMVKQSHLWAASWHFKDLWARFKTTEATTMKIPFSWINSLNSDIFYKWKACMYLYVCARMCLCVYIHTHIYIIYIISTEKTRMVVVGPA